MNEMDKLDEYLEKADLHTRAAHIEFGEITFTIRNRVVTGIRESRFTKLDGDEPTLYENQRPR